jgi:hypothetical protein
MRNSKLVGSTFGKRFRYQAMNNDVEDGVNVDLQEVKIIKSEQYPKERRHSGEEKLFQSAFESQEPCDSPSVEPSQPRKRSHKRTPSISEKVKVFFDGGQEMKKRKRLSYLILDFGMVHGVDSTAVSSFNKIVQLAEANNITLILVQMTPKVEKVFRMHKVIDANEEQKKKTVRIFHGNS